MDWDKLRALTDGENATVRFMGEAKPPTKLRSVTSRSQYDNVAEYLIEVVGDYTAGMKKMYIFNTFAACVDAAYAELVEFIGGHLPLVVSDDLSNDYPRFRDGLLEAKMEDLCPIVAAALKLQADLYAEQCTKDSLFRLRKALEAVWGHPLPRLTLGDTYKSLSFTRPRWPPAPQYADRPISITPNPDCRVAGDPSLPKPEDQEEG
jgi:hypothetical protein